MNSADAETAAMPVSQANRIQIIDIIRGFALLGILMMNIPYFSMPEYFSEPFRTDTTSLNFWTHAVVTVLFEGKMRALFSMVFGAGILLFTAKKEQTSKSVTWLFYRRMFWLVLFGLFHAHVMLWMGDILYLYGVCGMLVFLFRKVKPVYLVIGVPLVAILGFVASTSFLRDFRESRLAYLEVKKVQDSGKKLTSAQEETVKKWKENEKEFLPNKEQVKENTRIMKSGYATVAKKIRKMSFDGQTKYLIYSIWDPIALMLLGIALFKWGFFKGEWLQKNYLKTALIGYGVGLPLVIWNYYYNFVHFPTTASFISYIDTHDIIWMDLVYPVQRIALVMAHVALFIFCIKEGYFKKVFKALAAVGQMAFTNYIMHSLICTLFFFGYGLNYFAELQYYQLFYVVFSIWAFQLIVSPLWLKYFLFGPLEWVWRSLTYWKVQPFKR
ncbi:DUF418 domain-containing protein [Emticicia sp. CRIBPO]|uniref:DUF418 domain-containing protein n=1 Tax=Emticicia sp. CRIBPO TaxID=2683258 RepID=UPI001413069D|nr:DUF418 domain-containing protein [Emticicia sp. CRIBPO]NBA85770.1 DUF418 domain-containing protein [Emticicia sp. CRIBPO]